MTEKEKRPGCGKNDSPDLSRCGRGKGCAESGIHPEHMHGGNTACPPLDHDRRNMNEKLIILLRDISHLMRMQYEGKASQKRVLIILRESGPITQKALTERLGIQPGSASEILFKLESAGLITRTQNGTDRRTADIQLTDHGAELASEAAEQRQKRHQEMFACLTPEEKETLLSLLARLLQDWESRFSGSDLRGHHHSGGREHENHAARRGGDNPAQEQ